MNPGERTSRLIVVLVIAVAAAALSEPPSVRAQIERRGFEPPELIQLSGHLGPPYSGETGGWNLKLGVRFTPTHYDYHLYELRVVNSGRLGEQILFAVEPYRPNFFLFGSKDDMAKLETASAEELVKITGWRRAGSRVLSVTAIDVSPAPTPTVRQAPIGPTDQRGR